MCADGNHEVKNLELIHKTAWQALRNQIERFRAHEQKVWRHAALLGVLGGAGFVTSYPTALSTWQTNSGLVACLFAASYLLLLGSAIVGVFCFVMAMKFNDLRSPAPSEGFVEEFDDKTYKRSLVGLAKGALEARSENKDVMKRKEAWAKVGWHSLRVGVLSAAGAGLFYVITTT